MLRIFLGDWLYWPIVVLVISFASTVVLNSVSICWSEMLAQFKELRRVGRKVKEPLDVA